MKMPSDTRRTTSATPANEPVAPPFPPTFQAMNPPQATGDY